MQPGVLINSKSKKKEFILLLIYLHIQFPNWIFEYLL